MSEILLLLHQPVVRGALIAFVTAFGVDLHTWKSWGDVAFNWRTASFRWVSATIFGALAGAGLGAVS